MSDMYAEEFEQRNNVSSGASATTCRCSSSAAAVRGHANEVKSSMTNTKTMADVRIGHNILKEDGCNSDTETEIGLNITGSDAKNAMQNDDDDASAQSQPQETTFPQHLMDMIESETTDDNAVTVQGQKAIEWLSNGDKFIIRDKVALESRVLPKHFNNKCKFMSFVRKLYR